LPEEAWHKGAAYPQQYRTVEQMAHWPAEHFEEHAAHLAVCSTLIEGNQYVLAGSCV
jgi:Ni/Co efflux regulator RcnB